jgi:hypothetical protein
MQIRLLMAARVMVKTDCLPAGFPSRGRAIAAMQHCTAEHCTGIARFIQI